MMLGVLVSIIIQASAVFGLKKFLIFGNLKSTDSHEESQQFKVKDRQPEYYGSG